jgi:HEAT repeat protein
VLWIMAQVRLRREYVDSLLNTLHRRRLNFTDAKFEISDEATIKTLERALASNDVGEALHALELLPWVSGKGVESLQRAAAAMLSHGDEEVRVAALAYLGQCDALLDSEPVRAMLDDSSPKVRRAAVLAYCAIAREQAIARAIALLDDTRLEVRAGAVAALVRYGGLDGVLACADQLKRMLVSPDIAEREQSAWVLGEVGVPTFCRPLLPLFDDKAESVRLAAIHAAGKLKSPELVPALLAQLGHSRLSGQTAIALAGYGSGIRQAVADLLANHDKPVTVRANACRVLARLADAASAEAVAVALGDSDAAVRGAAISALTAMAHTSPGLRLDKDAVEAALRREVGSMFERMALAEDLRLNDELLLLRDAIEHRQQQGLGRIFGLLGLLYPPETIELVHRNLRSAQVATRANAVEVLDNLLEKEAKAYIIPLVDEAPAQKKLAQVAGVFAIPRRERVARLAELLNGHDSWLRVTAAVAVAACKEGALAPEVNALLDSDDPVCRETAIVVLRQLADAPALRERLEPLRHDPAPAVCRYATHVLAHLA